MKFTQKQIERVSALRTELVRKVNAFEHGVEYGKKIFTSEDDLIVWPDWISNLAHEIDSLMIEEMKIGDIDVSEMSKVDFYISLGAYFEKVERTMKEADEEIYPYFHSIVFTYKDQIMEIIKK